MNKQLIFADKVDTKDSLKLAYDALVNDKGGCQGTQIIFTDNKGNTHIEHNKTIIAGAQFTAMKHFGIERLINIPNYNTELGIDNVSQAVPDNVPIICLFAVGTQGCGIESNQVYPVEYTNHIHPDYLIPFRYEKLTEDLPEAQRSMYYGRKEFSDAGRVAYYFKAFETDPQMHMEYIDGTAITSSVYDNHIAQKAVTYVELSLKITKSDLRDWFIQNDDLANARFNCLSLISGWYKTGVEDGYKYYMDTLPITQLNFPNEPLMDLTRSVSILYRIFY